MLIYRPVNVRVISYKMLVFLKLSITNNIDLLTEMSKECLFINTDCPFVSKLLKSN